MDTKITGESLMSITIWSNNNELAKQRYPDAIISDDETPVDNSYDIVFLDHFINQTSRKNIPGLIKYFIDKLKVNGQLIIVVPSLEWACMQIAREAEPPILAYLSIYGTDDEPTLSGFTLNWLRKLCEDAGLLTLQTASNRYKVTINEKEEIGFQHVYLGMKRGAEEAF